jgi:hypothetical protein
MTHKDEERNILFIAEEPPGRCELCGAVEETRPYGPGGKQVCFSCGMKDEEEAERQFRKLFVAFEERK